MRQTTSQTTRQDFYFTLLKQWCDKLLTLQITQIQDPRLYGGMLCPSCARVHGRCPDAIYPLMYLAEHCPEERAKYLTGAQLLFDWGENMARPGGYYINDTNSFWNGITVFSSIQLGEALLYHGHLLDGETRGRWTRRLRLAADYLHGADLHSNINYPITCAASMALAHKVLGDGKYAERARQMAHEALGYLTPEGLIYGEGKPNDAVTPKGCRPVDLGYNVEESLGGLAMYGALMGDEEVLGVAETSLRAHLAFMLPDGGWDNSWGSRSNKWTYWGSRTSDGCQIACALLAGRDPVFAEAAYQNALLYRRCTHEGLLYGGPMYVSAGEPPCAHHTFCHAKALAALLEHGGAVLEEGGGGAVLPRAAVTGVGVARYPSIDTYLVHAGAWRATVTGYDFEYVPGGHPTGGAVSMLWREGIGAVFAGTMTEYQLVEPNNMQIPQRYGDICLTPRVELEDGGTIYRSCNDRGAVLECEEGDGGVICRVRGKLRDTAQGEGGAFFVEYWFAPEGVRIRAESDAVGAVLRLPVIVSSEEEWVRGDLRTVTVVRDGGAVTVAASAEIELEERGGERMFNPCGGFEALPLVVAVGGGVEVRVTA